jgi:hypothetical protein
MACFSSSATSKEESKVWPTCQKQTFDFTLRVTYPI